MGLKLVGALVVLASLVGCASSTQVIVNDKLSDIAKAKSLTSYKEVLLIPPKEDPRKVVPRVVSDIESMGLKVRLMDPNKPIEGSQGTAFVIGSAGWLLTCAHVLDKQTEATVTLQGKRLIADVVKSDTDADLALLKLREPLPADAAVLGLRAVAKLPAMGEDVFTIGYPLSRVLGNNARMTRGLLSATTGMRDDPKQMQISAEIQPGNSGGPLLDHDGNVMGIINQTLNPLAVAQSTGGALPQNVNFAIKAVPIVDFIKSADANAYAALKFDQGKGLEQAGKAVAKIQAGIVTPDSERNDKMVVRLTYISQWDIWYRFRLFALTAYDFETQERLFAAGQGRDNMVSNEDVVIRDTMDKFRHALDARAKP